MTRHVFLKLIVVLFWARPVLCQPVDHTKKLYGVFDGRTPCRELAKQLHQQVTPECIKIKWRLVLYKDSSSGEPLTYTLQGITYKKDTPRAGEWHIITGTKSHAEAIVYRLDQEGGVSLFLQKGDDNVLFFLDDEKKLLVGNKDFSYTLNRVNKTF